jgi:hypothetical protein
MKQLLIIALSICTMATMAQKNITCKKGTVKAAGQPIAEYDGKGGMFKSYAINVFGVDTKDTLINIKEEVYSPEDPLFPPVIVAYKLSFYDAAKTNYFIKSPYDRIGEKQIMELLLMTQRRCL